MRATIQQMPENEEPINEGSEGTPRDAAPPSAARTRSDPQGLGARGAWRDRVRIAADFDELPDDIADAFGAR
jgi:hypothetical protein